jgi:branched-chain amino acid transport system ATP-binding protein
VPTSDKSAGSLLELRDADVYYGAAQALHGMQLALAPGEVLGLVGRNGAGKSTVLKTIMGLLPLARGDVLLDGISIGHWQPQDRNRAGIAYVPEDRQVFPNLTTEENLDIATVLDRSGPWSVDRVYELFPRLLTRRHAPAQALSGGEQQMLAIGRAVLTQPRLLLLDEPTEGLAPQLVQEMIATIARVAESGVAVLLVEQNFRIPMQLAHRFCVIENGSVAWSGSGAAYQAQQAVVEHFISV